MPLSIPNSAALLIIDAQQAFDDPFWGARYPAQVDQRLEQLLAAWRSADYGQVVIVRHDSVSPDSLLRPDRPDNAIKPFATPKAGEWLVSKTVNSAFIGTDLESRLQAAAIDTVVIAGYTSQHCVNTTARMAGNLGFRVVVVEDACAAFELSEPGDGVIPAQLVQRISMASLNGEFATVANSEEVIKAFKSPA